jgi:hypothetical protein
MDCCYQPHLGKTNTTVQLGHVDLPHEAGRITISRRGSRAMQPCLTMPNCRTTLKRACPGLGQLPSKGMGHPWAQTLTNLLSKAAQVPGSTEYHNTSHATRAKLGQARRADQRPGPAGYHRAHGTIPFQPSTHTVASADASHRVVGTSGIVQSTLGALKVRLSQAASQWGQYRPPLPMQPVTQVVIPRTAAATGQGRALGRIQHRARCPSARQGGAM